MNRYFRLCSPLVAAFGIAVSVCAGCGGGGSSSGAGGSGNLNGTISDAQRNRALADIQVAYGNLPRLDRAADAQTLLHFLQSRPEIVYAAISDDLSVWGWFPDGQPICMVNNEPY